MRQSYSLSTYQRMITNDLHNLLTKTHTCLAKDSTCNRVIRAHSIPRAALSRIAEEHKVYCYWPMSHQQLKDIQLYHMTSPRKYPISKVSTFSGFCGRHDNDLFKQIDNQPIIPTRDQSIRLMLRAAARNCYDAVRAPEVTTRIHSRRPPWKSHTAADEREHLDQFKKAAASREWTRANLSHVLGILGAKNFEKVRTLFLRIDQVPDVMCCDVITGFVPLSTVTVSADKLGGYVHVAWLKDSPKAEGFIEAWRSIHFDLNSLTKMIFTYLYNYAFRISWWDSLSVVRQRTLMQLASYSVHTFFDSPDFNKNVRPLLDKRHQYHRYQIEKVYER